MKIKCRTCGHTEKTSIEFFVKLIGGVMPIGGAGATSVGTLTVIEQSKS